jgi:hypothetical protein
LLRAYWADKKDLSPSPSPSTERGTGSINFRF